jgi:ribonucleoside-diphosphate reductase alpha chain
MTSIVEDPRDSPNVGERRGAEVRLPAETLAAFGGDELRARVFYEKYALRDPQGRQVERVPEDMWRRVARELASPERDEEKKKDWATKFYWLLQDFRFVPGGRVLFGAGQSRKSTLLNCYFFKIREDSIEAIFDWCREAARTYSFGGGVGTDISVLRPKGAPVNNSAIYSSGSVSFMELLSTTTGTIGQAGRRGALMITIRVDHPDVMDFIGVKRDLKRVNYANISVKISDDFMRAVEADEDFLLHFKNEKVEMNKTVRAKEVWKSLIRGAWQSAEPGVLFWDTIKRESTTEYNGMEVQGVNPCVTGETLVRTQAGWRRADSLLEGDRIVTAYGYVKPITRVERTEDVDVYHVEFTDGSSIDVSPGHIFHSRRRQSGDEVRFDKFWDRGRRISELEVGDIVRVGRVYAPPEREVETHGMADRDFGFVVGALLGDGSITEAVLSNGQAKVASDKRETEWNELLVERFSAIAPRIAVSADARSNSCYVYLYKDGTEFITQHTLLRPSKSSAKEIPMEYVNSNKEFHVGLLDGLFSTDGDVDLNPSNPCMRLTSTSRRLLEQTKLILQFYGMSPKIYRSARKGKVTRILGRDVTLNHDAFHLCLYGNDLKRFNETFSLSHPGKQRKLEKVRDMASGSSSDSTRIKRVTYAGRKTVFDVYEEETDTWITNGYVSRGCSEQTLESYGCCCLGSVNLSAFVKEPFTEKASIDWESLTRATQYGVRFLDNILDYNAEKHPLPQQKDASLWSRRIGVGITGLGDMLIKLGLKYDEDSTIEFVDHLFERIKNVIYDYSTEVAKEKGSFPAFDAGKHLAQPFVARLDEKVKQKIKAQGIRNAAITTVPPVGSGSILAGTSSGVEPVFALYYTRRSKSLSEGEFKVFHPLVKEYMAATGATDEGQLPNYFVTSHQIRPEMRVKMQATIQKHIDTAISSTVNLPQEITTEEVEKIYLLAWKTGCKGITVYREGSREGILETEKVTKKAEQPRATFERPRMMEGRTLKLKLPQGGLYLTANLVNGELKEVFVTLGKSGGDEKADAEALGRLISLYLQHGGDIKSVISTLKGIKGKYVSWDEGTQLLSIPDAVAKALELLTLNHVVKEAGFVAPPGEARQASSGGTCPDCHESSLIFENGCYRCTNCGYSKCE